MAIYYLCPDDPTPSGGIRQIYRNVDMLRRGGLEAYVVHEHSAFRPAWFAHDTPAKAWSSTPYRPQSESLPARVGRRLERRFRPGPDGPAFLQLHEPPSFPIGKGDVLAVPEIYGPGIPDLAPGVPKVILNMGVYLSFEFYSERTPPGGFATVGRDVVATITVSEDAAALLRHAFPAATILHVRPSVEPALFHEGETKLPRISYIPRRHSAGPGVVLSILAARGALDGFEVVPISGLSEADAAREIRRTLVMLLHRHLEGFGLPGLEAMACGAAAVGYHGNGGREYLRPDLAYPVPTADVLAFAETLEGVLDSYRSDPETVLEKGRRAAAFVRETYSPENEQVELVAAWEKVLTLI